MTLNPHTEEYYKKFIELQENLRKSEAERLKLEMKFNEMVRITKEQTQMHYRKLRAQYKKFLDEDRKRQDRNEKILRNLENIETRLSMITAKTERFQLLRQQYRAMLDRIYKTKLNQIPRREQKSDHSDIVEHYLKNMSSQHVKDLLENDGINKNLNDYDRNDDLSSFIDDSVEYRPNFANSLADDILQSIDKKRDKFDDDNNRNNNTSFMTNERTQIGRQDVKKPEIHIETLPGNSTGNETDDESSDKLNNELGIVKMENLPNIQQIQEKLEEIQNENCDESLEKTDRVIDEFDTLPTEKINIQENNEPIQPNSTETNNENIPEENQQTTSETLEQEKGNAATIPETVEISTAELQGDRNLPEREEEAPEELNSQHDQSPTNNQDDENQKIDSHEISETQYDDKVDSLQREPDVMETHTKDDPDVQKPITEVQNDATDQFYPEYPNSEPQYNENGELIPQYDENGQLIQQFDGNGQLIPQYDEHGQLLPQYDTNGQLIPQYDQNGLLIPQYDENGQLIPQYDQYGQVIPQYDQNGQVIPQYDQNGQVIPQYDQNGQVIPQFDENGQLIPQYDEHGQEITQYYNDTNLEYGGDQNKFENYPEQYDDTKPETVDGEIIEDTGNNGKTTTETIEETTNKVENNEEIRTNVNQEHVVEDEMAKSKPKVLEMLDTDTESIKQDTKISNDSDFDFSNS